MFFVRPELKIGSSAVWLNPFRIAKFPWFNELPPASALLWIGQCCRSTMLPAGAYDDAKQTLCSLWSRISAPRQNASPDLLLEGRVPIQTAKICEYAERRGIEIVRTYAEAASGLGIAPPKPIGRRAVWRTYRSREVNRLDCGPTTFGTTMREPWNWPPI